MAKVMVVDDDPVVRAILKRTLELERYEVVLAEDGNEGLRALWSARPDLVILDVNMPGLDGWQVLQRVRELSSVPVIMLTIHADELNRVRGLRAGADDYVAKPFGRQELLARIGALLRRAAREAREEVAELHADDLLTIDHRQRVVRATASGEELALTPLEYRMLTEFARHPGQVLSREQVVELVWGDPYVDPAQVKLLVGRLRRKLATVSQDEVIGTVRGFGYRYAAA